MTSEPRISRSPPCFPEAIAVEQPENPADDEQDTLVERPGKGQKAERAAPSQRPWDTAVANHNPDGSEGSDEEGACSTHAASLDRKRN